VSTIERYSAHYTPESVSTLFVSDLLDGFVFDSAHGIRIYDPACGDGALLLGIAKYLVA